MLIVWFVLVPLLGNGLGATRAQTSILVCLCMCLNDAVYTATWVLNAAMLLGTSVVKHHDVAHTKPMGGLHVNAMACDMCHSVTNKDAYRTERTSKQGCFLVLLPMPGQINTPWSDSMRAEVQLQCLNMCPN